MSRDKFFDDQLYLRFGLIMNLLFVVSWYLINDGLAFWDDFTYLNFAQQVNQGVFEVSTNHFTSRVAMIYPVAWIIEVVGINSYTITLFPFLCGLVILNLLLWIGNKFHHWIGVLASIFFICDYHVLTFVSHLFPEMPMALFLFGAVLAYDLVNRGEGDHRLLALVCSGFLFLAFLTKMTVILIAPVFIFFFINDYWRTRKNRSFWLITVVLLIFFVLVNGFWYRELYGDFFYRFSNISDNHEASSKTFFDKDGLTILKRLTYLPFKGFVTGGFFIPLLFALPSILTLKKGDWRLRNPSKIWAIAVIFTLGTWWFMSTNWRYYSPMPVDTRHLTFLIPMMILAGAQYWSSTHLLTAIRYSKAKYWLLFFLLIPAYKVARSGDTHFNELESVMQTEIVPLKEKVTVFSDGLISYGYPYFYDFNPKNHQYYWFSQMNDLVPKSGDYLLYNEAYLNERYQDQKYLKDFKSALSSLELKLKPLNEGGVYLYKIE